MRNERRWHFSLSVDEKIYVFGGFIVERNVIEIFDGREWSIGPTFPFFVLSYEAQAVVDRKQRIIIITSYHGIIVYDPIQGVIKDYPDLQLRETRKYFSALLQRQF